MRKLLTAAALAGVLAATNLFAQDAQPRDTIRLIDGGILPGVVLSETPSEVRLDKNGDGKVDQTLDQNDVRSVDYGNVPPAYAQGAAYLRVRQYEKAVANFKDAAADSTARRWVKDYATYYVAVSLARLAEANPAERPKAVQAFETVVRDANNRWRDDARYQLGDLQLAAGDRAQALATFGTLEKEAHRNETRLNAALGLATLLMEDQKPADALKRFDAVVDGAKGKYPDLYVSALVGKAEAQTALKQYAEAEQFLTGVLKDSTNEDVLAKAHAALGDCWFAQAEAAKDEDARSKYKTALKHYLWNVVVFFNQKNECAKSLLYAGKCWDKLGETARAQELYERLRKDFGATKWAGMIGR